METEEFPEIKAAPSVKEQIKWSYMVVLIVTHLIAFYAAVVVVPRVGLITFIWCRWRLIYLLHTYTSI